MIEAGRPGHQPIGFLVPGRNRDQLRALALSPHCSRHVVARHVGQPDVEQYNIGLEPADAGEDFLAFVSGYDRVAFLAEQHRQGEDCVAVVVYYKDSKRAACCLFIGQILHRRILSALGKESLWFRALIFMWLNRRRAAGASP
jgi:hypothetical protein